MGTTTSGTVSHSILSDVYSLPPITCATQPSAPVAVRTCSQTQLFDCPITSSTSSLTRVATVPKAVPGPERTLSWGAVTTASTGTGVGVSVATGVEVSVGVAGVGVGVRVGFVVGVAVGGAWVDVAVAGGSVGEGTAVGASATCCDGNACWASVACWCNRLSLGDCGPVSSTTSKDQRQGQQQNCVFSVFCLVWLA